MTAPAFFFTGCCFGKVPFDKTNRPENKFKTGNHLFFIAPCIDALLSLSCLAVGILGITNVISIPAASCYALVGVAGAITAAWIAMTILVCYSLKK